MAGVCEGPARIVVMHTPFCGTRMIDTFVGDPVAEGRAMERKDVWAAGDLYEPYVGRWSRLVARVLGLVVQTDKRGLVGCRLRNRRSYASDYRHHAASHRNRH
jgi:hypothetical protein